MGTVVMAGTVITEGRAAVIIIITISTALRCSSWVALAGAIDAGHTGDCVVSL